MKRKKTEEGNEKGKERKKRRLVRSSYIGYLKNWNRDGATQIIISGDCEEIGMITFYEGGIKNGTSYSFYRKTGRLINVTNFKNDRIVNQLNLIPCPVENKIIDNEDGSRWEGACCLSRSCGMGEEFDAENNLIYRGIGVNNHREGYGCSYYPHIYPLQTEYDGEWSYGMRQGHGTLYDRAGDIVYSGLWFQGNRAELAVNITSDKEPITFSTLVEELTIGSEICNSVETINISACEKLKRFIVNKKSFRCVKQLDICGMRCLEEIIIRNNSFSEVSCSWESQRNSEMFTKAALKGLVIQKNPKLRNIKIGRNCFSDFTKVEIKGGFFRSVLNIECPLLDFLTIGVVSNSEEEDDLSYCFYYANRLVFEELPKLESIEIGNAAFFTVRYVAFKNLPSLLSLRFGRWACYGNDAASNDYNTIELLNLPSLTSLNAYAFAFYMFLHFSVDQVPKLKRIRLVPTSFNFINKVKQGSDVPEELIYWLENTYRKREE